MSKSLEAPKDDTTRQHRVRISESHPQRFYIPKVSDEETNPSDLWYSEEDISEFKADVCQQTRQLIISSLRTESDPLQSKRTQKFNGVLRAYKQKFIEQHIKDDRVESAKQLGETDSEGKSEDTCCFRGLEYRASFERQHDRHVAIRAILLAQRRLKALASRVPKDDAAQCLARISLKCTKRAGEDARIVGRADFKEAHHITLNSELEESSTIAGSNCSTDGQPKRKHSTGRDSQN